MNPSLLALLAGGITPLQDIPNENAVTTALATAIHSSGARKFWTASSVWPMLHGAECSTSWKASKAYDLSWATAATAAHPDHLLQVKLGNKTQEDQEVLLFLGDLAFAALDYSLYQQSIVGVAVIPIGRATSYWSRLVPLAGTQMSLVLDPSTASNAMARGSAWIDPMGGRIAPTTKSQYSKIFGAGTNAKFIGLFHRHGKVTMTFDVHLAPAGFFSLLAFKVSAAPQYQGPGSLQEWWP